MIKELLGSKKLLNTGNVDGCEEGSDSAPSEDNMEEEDINKIMNKEPEVVEPKII